MHSFALPLVVFAGIASSSLADSLCDGPYPTESRSIANATDACTGPNARTQPPAGAIVVDASGAYNGSYLTVSEGVANIPNTTAEHTLFILPGVYHEQVVVPKFNGPLVFQGYTCDTMSYADNQVTVTHTMAQRDLPANATSSRNALVSTMLFKTGKGVKVYNLNVANPTGKINQLGQAVATYVDNTDYGFYACNFTGYQDTLCANKGKELYARSYIAGAVDFVFGQKSKSWFESCDIETVGYGSITANGNGNGNSSNLSEYVFNNARVFGSNGNGTAYLGRPWYPYARVVWQKSELSDVINPQGWQEWNKDNNTANVYFKEFNNSGAGAATNERVSFSGQLDASVDITEILGEDYKSNWWVDANFL